MEVAEMMKIHKGQLGLAWRKHQFANCERLVGKLCLKNWNSIVWELQGYTFFSLLRMEIEKIYIGFRHSSHPYQNAWVELWELLLGDNMPKLMLSATMITYRE
jgi:hypothetical protein